MSRVLDSLQSFARQGVPSAPGYRTRSISLDECHYLSGVDTFVLVSAVWDQADIPRLFRSCRLTSLINWYVVLQPASPVSAVQVAAHSASSGGWQLLHHVGGQACERRPDLFDCGVTYCRSPGGPAMALNLGKLMLALLWVGLSLSAVQAQPSAQNINPNVSLTLNSTTLLYSGQTVTVNFPKPVHHVHHVRVSHKMRERCHVICTHQHHVMVSSAGNPHFHSVSHSVATGVPLPPIIPNSHITTHVLLMGMRTQHRC